eukprot:TRINITY_DN4370_c0_g3_i1.p1 TRINITY_DN4370_c0_g3~~TRINITY_DN4370_c0_g3_i1.p1  ORF type:complete len:582 (+),score=64.50 TRINITY_DN4370_c0_g3_i1:47-1792(+)
MKSLDTEMGPFSTEVKPAKRTQHLKCAAGLLIVMAGVLLLHSPLGHQRTAEHLSRKPGSSSQEFQIRAPEILQRERLLQYNRSDLLAASISEDILLTLERDVQRLLVMREMAPKRFKRILPHDYTQRKFTERVSTMATAGILAAGGVPQKVLSLDGIFKISRLSGLAVVNNEKFIEWLATYKANMQEATKKMVRNGADAGAVSFKDVTLGTIHEAYYDAFLAHNTYSNVAPTIIEATPMRTGGCGASNKISQVLVPGDICALPKQLTQGILYDDSQACIECSVNGKTGWINGSHVVPYGWYKFERSFGSLGASVPIYKELESNSTSTDLPFGEAFTIVERRRNAVRLGDGRGWIRLTPELSASLKGPLIEDETKSERQRQISRVMEPKPRHTSSIPRAVTDATQRYNTPGSVIFRTWTKNAFVVGGFLGIGAMFVPAVIFGVGDAVLGIALTKASKGRALDKVSFLMIALARLEDRVFNQRSNAACDTVSTPCPQGEVCWRHGIFHRVAGNRSSQSSGGFCIRTPWPLLPDNSPCAVDLDCASSHCKFKNYSEDDAGSLFGSKVLIDALRGYCAPGLEERY